MTRSTPKLRAGLTGTGTYYREATEVWEQVGHKPADILFTLSRSGSMVDDTGRVLANLSDFAEEISALEADYHVAVAVEDDGCFHTDYVTSDFSFSEADEALQTMADIYFILGNYGAFTERGFSLADEALTPARTGAGGCNEGFLRDEASLELVHISDDAEHSLQPYSYYVSHFQSLKADPADVTFHAVAGDYPSGCGTAGPGLGYYEASVATGGLFLSICDKSWAEDVVDLAEDTVWEQDTFTLEGQPVPETLEVLEDGTVVPSGWAWDASLHAIVFDRESIPATNARLEVGYHVPLECE